MDPLTLESLGWLLTALIIVLVLFLLLRQLVLWYFRLNQIANDIAYIAQHYRVADREAGRQVNTKTEPSTFGTPPKR